MVWYLCCILSGVKWGSLGWLPERFHGLWKISRYGSVVRSPLWLLADTLTELQLFRGMAPGEGGEGGVLRIFLGGGVPPSPENPYPISDQNIRFSVPYFRPDSQNVYPISDPVMCGNFSSSQWIYDVRAFVAPETMFAFFFFVINVHSNTRHSKNYIPDQTDGIYTLFQTKMAKSIPYFRLEMLENGTLWGGTYLYGTIFRTLFQTWLSKCIPYFRPCDVW